MEQARQDAAKDLEDAKKPQILFVIAGSTIMGPDDYNVEYTGGDSIKAGTYAVSIKGKGRFTGTVSAEYTISKVVDPAKIKSI